MKKPRLLTQPSHQRVSRSEFEAALGTLRVDLLNMQFDLQSADFSVLVVIAGTDRAGCEQVLDVLQAWMDARHIESTVYENPREERRSVRASGDTGGSCRREGGSLCGWTRTRPSPRSMT